MKFKKYKRPNPIWETIYSVHDELIACLQLMEITEGVNMTSKEPTTRLQMIKSMKVMNGAMYLSQMTNTYYWGV